MRMKIILTALISCLIFAIVAQARHSTAPQGKKEYLSEAEADKIRDAYYPSERIHLYLGFAEDRLKKFQYELNRTVPERKRAEILNGLLNGYSGCMDDAADQIGIAKTKQQEIGPELKLMKSKGRYFLDILEKLDKEGQELETYKEDLEDAIDSTKDALEDVEKAEKELAPPVVRKPT